MHKKGKVKSYLEKLLEEREFNFSNKDKNQILVARVKKKDANTKTELKEEKIIFSLVFKPVEIQKKNEGSVAVVIRVKGDN